MIGATGRLALYVYGADWALFILGLVLQVAWHFMCTGLIGHCLSYDWCYESPGTLCVRG